MTDDRRPDPLEAIGADQRAAIRHRANRRRRMRLAVTGVAAFFTLAVGSAGAGALIFGSTGIATLDDYLNMRQAHRGRTAGLGPPDTAPPPMAALPKSDNVSPPLKLPGRNVRVLAYANTSDQLCFATTSRSSKGARFPKTNFGCLPAEQVTNLPPGQGAIGVTITGVAEFVVGYASGDAGRVRVRGPRGPLTTRVTAPWTPDLPDGKPIRIFGAYEGRSIHERGRRPIGDPRRFKVTVVP